MRSIATVVGLGLVVSLFAGCPGKVEFSELDKFGSVRSAVWLEVTVRDPESEYTTHVLVLNSKPGLCKAYQTALPELGTFNEQIYDLWYGYWYDYDYYDYDYPDYSQICGLYQDYWTHLADSLDRYYGEGARSMAFNLMEVDGAGDHEWDTPPADGTYDAMGSWDDMDAGRYFDMTVTHYHDNPFRLYAQQYNNDSEYSCFGYYNYDYDLYEDLEAALDLYWLDDSDGTSVMTMKGDSKVKVEFSGGLSDEEGDSAGTVEGSFTATHCPVTIESDSYMYMYFYFF